MQIIHPKRSQREPMFNIHEMTTMWSMQTLYSTEKRVIRKGDVFYAHSARVISTEIMLYLLIFNKMVKKKNNLKTRTKLKHTNIQA